MKIKIEGINNTSMRERIRKMIKDKEVLTWEFVEEDNYYRLMHNGDEQYEDVVLMFKSTKGKNYVNIEPKVRDGVEGLKEKETAESHFGVVMGRFAELLNCHFADLGSYKTYL